MPQLKITNYLTHDIMRNVAELYKPHIDKAKWQDPVMTEMFYDIIVPEEGGLREAIAKLPACFITYNVEFPFRGILYPGKDTAGRYPYPRISDSVMGDFSIRFESPRPLPSQKFLPHCGMGETGKVDCNVDHWQPFLKMLDNHLLNIKQAEKQHKDAEMAVELLLDRHKTIQPVLRGWPALWDLLPYAAQETIAGPGNYIRVGGASGYELAYDNPVRYSPTANTFGDDAFASDRLNNALEHLTMMLVTKKINQRA